VSIGGFATNCLIYVTNNYFQVIFQRMQDFYDQKVVLGSTVQNGPVRTLGHYSWR